jgi:pimeloyl-ACP methyl ester carboxylesterase
MSMPLRRVQTSDLLVTYLEDGANDGWPVVLAHGFPYDVHAFDDVIPLLVEQGARVIRPFVRGYGPTLFLSSSTMRSGQQAALGRDLIEILGALGIEGAIVAGFD